MTIKEIQNQIIEEFSYFDEWLDKYEYLISLGQKLAPLDNSYKIEKYAIKGCQSRVWIVIDNIDGKISLKGDSEALITKGILSLLIRIFNNQLPVDVVDADIFFDVKTGLSKSLSPSRAHGMKSMIQQIKYYTKEFE
ncbi:MAG: SufE family protein [Candidatus Hodarchaeales archaeon]|jgi:cysteine desulfuration protein SufE